MVFTPDGTRAISAGEDGLLCLYDVSQGYHPMRVVACDEPQPGRPISLSVGSLAAVIRMTRIFSVSFFNFRDRRNLKGSCKPLASWHDLLRSIIQCDVMWEIRRKARHATTVFTMCSVVS